MTAGIPGHESPAATHTPMQKRSLSSLFCDGRDDGDDHSRSATTAESNAWKKPKTMKLELTYPEDEVRAAMRDELVCTPGLKQLHDELVDEMMKCKQVEGRQLCNNNFYFKTKSVLRNNQERLVDLKRYLQAEAFIRTDCWMLQPLRKWFEAVEKAGLEREFRDAYWQKNQRVFSTQIGKLAASIPQPNMHNKNVAKQYFQDAKDIVSRSVHVIGRGNPIIRSAVAIMIVASEQETAKSSTQQVPDQETADLIPQIWVAWCLARRKDYPETRFLATTILHRMESNVLVRNCFHHLRGDLVEWSRKEFDKEKCSKWQNMHWKCHIISPGEFRARPVAFQGDDRLLRETQKDIENKLKFKPIHEPLIRRQSDPSSQQASASCVKDLQSPASPDHCPERTQAETNEAEKVTLQTKPNKTTTQVESEIKLVPASAVSTNPSSSATVSSDILSICSIWRSVFVSQQDSQTEKIYQEVSTKLAGDIAKHLSPLDRRLDDIDSSLQRLTGGLQIIGDRDLSQETRLLAQEEKIYRLQGEIDQLKEMMKENPRQQASKDQTHNETITCVSTRDMPPSMLHSD